VGAKASLRSNSGANGNKLNAENRVKSNTSVFLFSRAEVTSRHSCLNIIQKLPFGNISGKGSL